MVKLICQKCNKVWYSSNELDGQKCSECGGLLKKSELSSKSQEVKQ
jgi:rRNA maturation endonuclease Nob1